MNNANRFIERNLFFSSSILGKIVGSWFISPVLSGAMSTILFWSIRSLILKAKNPLNAGLIALPLIYGLTTCINVVSIVFDGPKCKYSTHLILFCSDFAAEILSESVISSNVQHFSALYG